MLVSFSSLFTYYSLRANTDAPYSFQIFVPPPDQEPKNAWIAKKRHAVENLLRRQAASTFQDSQANCGQALAAFLFSSEEKEQANSSVVKTDPADYMPR
jgi:hypothetical protein